MKIWNPGDADRTFIKEVENESGQTMAKCYQCGNCTAGCPMSFAFDIPVSRIMRNIQAGNKDAVMESRSIWMCATCEVCTQRCPNDIEVARVMDVCRHIARREGKKGGYVVRAFHSSFLDSIKWHGKVHEIGLMAEFMFRTARFWTDVDLVPTALPKNKMSILPHRAEGRKEVADIFRRFSEGAADEDKIKAQLAQREDKDE